MDITDINTLFAATTSDRAFVLRIILAGVLGSGIGWQRHLRGSRLY